MIAAISVYAIAQGLTYPLLSFILARQGHSPGMIGLSAAMTPIGFICCAPFVPAHHAPLRAGDDRAGERLHRGGDPAR